jgi:hypothetical protein
LPYYFLFLTIPPLLIADPPEAPEDAEDVEDEDVAEDVDAAAAGAGAGRPLPTLPPLEGFAVDFAVGFTGFAGIGAEPLNFLFFIISF